MLKRLLRKLKAWLGGSGPASPAKDQPQRTQPTVKVGDRVGGVKILTSAQLDKHTPFKPGESYRVGEMIVTVHATKEDMKAAIAAVDARREARHAALKEKAVDIMMMSPEQLKQFNIDKWFAARKPKDTLIRRIMGKYWDKERTNYFRQLEAKYAAPPTAPTASTEPIKEKVPVNVK